MKSSALVLFKTASDVVGKLAAFGVLAIAARVLTTDDFAWMALASTAGWMLSVATDFGLQLHLAKEVARMPDAPGRALWPLLKRKRQLLAAGFFAAVVLPFVWLDARVAVPFAGIALAFLLSSLVEFLNYAYRGLNRSDLESSINLMQRLGGVAFAWVLLTWWPSLLTVAIALLVPPMITSAISLTVLTRMAPSTPEAESESAGDLFWRVAPIGTGILLSALYFRLDVFLLQHWSGATAVAQYGAVFRLIDAMRLFPAALLAVMLPRMFRGHNTSLLLKLSVGLTGFGVLASATLYALAPVAVPLAFGDAFTPAVPLFRILLAAFPLLCLNYGLTTQLIGWDGQRAFAWLNAGAFAANIAMNTVLIPRIAAAGAAWATVATEALLTVGCLVALRRAQPRISARDVMTSR